ncbi:MAG: ferrous iron transport protein A [Comamonas sp.]|uniref:FeoA family protein n=1 Tax=Comamonas sp. TaxID=34028 RepID=UPI00282296D9|nr:FeoA family protein [Comamonas sp.]MDR0217059.1 ferrous iron transport protein A [Comamonas sp.]MDR2297545.1 ferrous iron transport protein A [Comamonas sp.]
MSNLQSSAPGSAATVLASNGAAEAAQSPVSAQAAISLDKLSINQPALVVDLASAGNVEEQELMLRLMEIGFLPGERVRIVAAGFPGPDPLAVRVGAATFALRRYEASRVLVALEA